MFNIFMIVAGIIGMVVFNQKDIYSFNIYLGIFIIHGVLLSLTATEYRLKTEMRRLERMRK